MRQAGFAKNICLISLLTAHMVQASEPSSPVPGTADSGQFSLDARLFYFDRQFDLEGAQPARAFNGGGIAKYETRSFNQFKMAAGLFGSFNLFGIVDRELSAGTAMLQSDNSDIAFIGEAYVDYDTGVHQFRVGRQRLTTPLINDRDFRMLPSAFEAAVYRNRLFDQTILEAGYIYSETGFGSTFNGFEQQAELWGKDGLTYLYGEITVNGVALRAQFVDTLENSGLYQNFGYADVNIPLSLGEGTHLQAQLGSTAYQAQDNARMFGAKLSSRFAAAEVSLLYNQIRGNPYSAVEAGPLYSDWQQGYGNYEPSEALGIQLGYDINDSLHISAGYVDIQSETQQGFNLDSYAESVFDIIYWVDKQSHIRLRYSDKNQAADSDREDRQDFRLIYYYDLS